MAQHGGRRAGAGRKPASPEKQSLAEKARQHTDAALDVLLQVMTNTDQPGATRISAANSILDRGYGKPFQAQTDDPSDEAPVVKWTIEVREAAGAVRVTKPE